MTSFIVIDKWCLDMTSHISWEGPKYVFFSVETFWNYFLLWLCILLWFVSFCCMNVLVYSFFCCLWADWLRICLQTKYLDCPFFFLCRNLLSENKHVKYLYIPYTDSVVVVRCNPVSKWKGPPRFKPKYTKDEAIQHVRDLYRESLQKYRYGFT